MTTYDDITVVCHGDPLELRLDVTNCKLDASKALLLKQELKDDPPLHSRILYRQAQKQNETDTFASFCSCSVH